VFAINEEIPEITVTGIRVEIVPQQEPPEVLPTSSVRAMKTGTMYSVTGQKSRLPLFARSDFTSDDKETFQ